MKQFLAVLAAAMFIFSLNLAAFADDSVSKGLNYRYEKATSTIDLAAAKENARLNLLKVNADAAAKTFEAATEALLNGNNLFAVKLLDACQKLCELSKLAMPAKFIEIKKIAAMKLAQQRIQEALKSYLAQNFDEALGSMDQAERNIKTAASGD